jgi:putative SOS response-associated peptidase YedK
MCGRFVQSSLAEDYARLFGIEERNFGNLMPRYNVAPTQTTWACVMGPDGRRDLALLRWGLVPHWSKGPDSRYSMINARAETVHKKPAYREAFKRRRCLVPADGFYEWRTEKGGKQPHFIHRTDGEPMAFAGLWEHWKSPEGGDGIDSCAIIVTEANELMQPIHDRMPVIVAPGDFERWLQASPEEAESLLPLLRPAPTAAMEAYPVSKAVNNPKNEAKELIERLAVGED